MADHDAADWSEITILPDGRMYVFGMTLPLLEVLAALPTSEGRWEALLNQVRASATSDAVQETIRE